MSSDVSITSFFFSTSFLCHVSPQSSVFRFSGETVKAAWMFPVPNHRATNDLHVSTALIHDAKRKDELSALLLLIAVAIILPGATPAPSSPSIAALGGGAGVPLLGLRSDFSGSSQPPRPPSAAASGRSSSSLALPHQSFFSSSPATIDRMWWRTRAQV